MCLDTINFLVSIFGRIIFGRDDQTASLSRSSVHRFKNVDHFLLVFQRPVDFVVVSGAQVDHDVFVAEEKHDRARVVQFVHFVEVRHFGHVDQIDDGKVFDLPRSRNE